MQFVLEFDYGGVVYGAMVAYVVTCSAAGIATAICVSVTRREWWPLLATPIFAAALSGLLFDRSARQKLPQIWRALVRK